MTGGVEDHVEYIVVELALGRQHPLELVHGKDDLRPPREKGGRRLVQSDVTVYRLDGGALVPVLFRGRG